jgi:hypothetical protein
MTGETYQSRRPTQKDGKEESSKSSMERQGRHRTLRQELQERRRGVVGRGRTVRQQSEDAKGNNNWKEIEIIFRRAWKIKATMSSLAWMENNRQKGNESIAAFVTRVQNAVATTSREALTNKANNVKEKDEPKWNNHTEKYLAAQAVYDARAVATPWTPAEKEAIDACNREFGEEQ